jgi:Methyltransferase domain
MLGMVLRVARARPRIERVGRLPRTGVCASCARRTMFLTTINRPLHRRMRSWPYEEAVLLAQATRENYHCLWCGRNYRMRGLAAVARRWLDGARVFEPAAFGVFVKGIRARAASWTSSEFYPGIPSGSFVGSHRNEDLRRLSFPDSSFDVIITSEVLEHVDPRSPGGIRVVTDFGDDLPDRLRQFGFETFVHELPSPRDAVLRVYESRAV